VYQVHLFTSWQLVVAVDIVARVLMGYKEVAVD
jgi:hypothetical protein